MHLRKLILVCGFACALLSNTVAALGLGEARLNSTLNEPLNAEIKLLDSRGLSADQIIVALASPADFERNGVDRLYFLTEFEFEVLLNHPGGAIVRVTSRSPVREPFINFLVEGRWPTGRLLREYTLLMDLPTFSESAASAAVSAPTTQTATPRSSDPVSRQPARPGSVSSQSSPSTTRSPISGDSYTVGDRDTLWQIALDVRPDSSHSVHQTMLAIQRSNPDAFINGNINLLRKGQVLRIPSGDDIQSVSQREAVNEVARQNQLWSDDSMGAQLSANRRDTSARRDSGSVSGSVKLATPSRDDAWSGQGSGDDSGRGKALESELAASLEELDKAKSENVELNSRVRDLEDQIKTMERLVDVSNEQLRALQLGAAQNDQATAIDDDVLASDEVSDFNTETQDADPLSNESVSPDGDVAQADSAQEQTAPAVSEPAVPVDTKRVVVPPQPTKTIVDHVMDHILWVVLGVVTLVVLIGLVIIRRKKAAEADAETDDNFFDMEAADSDQDFDQESMEAMEDTDAEEMPLFDEDLAPAEAETGDVVGEADIYIAYGKFDQAEEMLLSGLAKDPNSVDIRLKLLEVYSQTQDVNRFDHYYAGLLGMAGQPALARAAELREHIGGAADFEPSDHLGDLNDASVDLSNTEDSFDLDIESDSLLDDSEDLTSEDDLDFSLDLDDDTPTQVNDEKLTSVGTRYDLSFDESIEEKTSSTDDDFSFDFDLEDSPTEKVELASAVDETLDDDIDELSFELDEETSPSLVAADSESFEVEEEDVDGDADLSFDFDEPVQTVAPASERVIAESPALETGEDEELQLPDDSADDFNLDMDMGDLDLAALDEEMEGLDADFAEAENLGDFDVEDTAELDDLELLDVASEDDIADELESLKPVTSPIHSSSHTESPAAEIEADDEEDVFDQALSEFAADSSTDNLADMTELDVSDDDMDAELDFLADADEAATKLDLARAYIDMGDTDGARDILAEVAHEGTEEQRQEAVDLLSRIDV